MSKTYKTTAVILRRVNYGEADRIITFLTPADGKISAIAKGVRRLNAKLAGHLEPFNQVELMLASGKNLDIVTSARTIKRNSNIAENYERLRLAFLCCEMVDKLTSEAQGSKPLYNLLSMVFETLDSGTDPALGELYFKLKLLDILGYRPDLSKCMESLEEIEAGKRYFFSAEKGGVVEKPYAKVGHPEITTDHIKLWRLVLDYPLSSLAKIRNVAQAASQSLPVADEFYDYLFGKRFKAAEI